MKPALHLHSVTFALPSLDIEFEGQPVVAKTLVAFRTRRKETDIPSMERMRTAVTFWDAENVVEAFICVLDTEA